MKYIIIISASLLFSSCFPSFKNSNEDKLFIKIIETEKISVEWYTYSAAYAEFPEYLISISNCRIDTICVSTNLSEVNLSNDTLNLFFYGTPKIYSTSVSIKSQSNNTTIVVDTTQIIKDVIVRKYFKSDRCIENKK